jgi:GH15 family glucan-1,4-alpha-glucosidase
MFAACLRGPGSGAGYKPIANYGVIGDLRTVALVATAFMHWIEDRCAELKPGTPLQVMYGIDGRHDLELRHFEGYRKSGPVRIGNAHQLQLDIYGELMDSVYRSNK